LVEARRRARERLIAYGFSPDSIQHPLFDQVYNALRGDYYRAQRAIEDSLRGEGCAGTLGAWGREGSAIGTWRQLDPDAWPHVRFRKNNVIELPGALQPILLYNVVVKRLQPETTASASDSTIASEKTSSTRRRRNAQNDALLKNRIETVLATAKTRWPNKGTRPPDQQMAAELMRLRRAEGYSADTLRKILNGTYEPAHRLGIDLNW
jgi:hypothetical protein